MNNNNNGLQLLDLEKEDVVLNENNFVAVIDEHKNLLKQDPYVQNLASKVDITQPQQILAFGEESSVGITTISDQLLNSIKMVKEEEAGELLTQLTKIMKKVDLEEVKKSGGENGFIAKIFNKAKKSIEELMSKYESIGSEIDEVAVILKRYEKEIIQETENLSKLYKTNIEYFKELEKYVVAGEMILEELDGKVIPQYENAALTSTDPLVSQNLELIRNCREMVDQRVYDLKLAENIAMQSLPMIQQIQRGNFELVKNIKSSFIITLPIFKQCLIQAIMIKRQDNRRKNMQDLKDYTNEMLIKNANNVARQSLELSKMNGQGLVDIEKLEQSFNIIQDGIREVKRQQEDNKKARQDGSKKLIEMKEKAFNLKQLPNNNGTSNNYLN